MEELTRKVLEKRGMVPEGMPPAASSNGEASEAPGKAEPTKREKRQTAVAE